MLTLVAVILPSLLANLQSDVEKTLENERHKCFIKQKIKDFLDDHKSYYQLEREEVPSPRTETSTIG